jgi:hypothetical protein
VEDGKARGGRGAGAEAALDDSGGGEDTEDTVKNILGDGDVGADEHGRGAADCHRETSVLQRPLRSVLVLHRCRITRIEADRACQIEVETQ